MDLICIDDNFSSEQITTIPNRPVKDKFYTFRGERKTIDGEIGIFLMEIENPKIIGAAGMYFEPGFNIKRFRTINGDMFTREMVRGIKKQELEKIKQND